MFGSRSMRNVVLLVFGILAGGIYMDSKLLSPTEKPPKPQIVYGTRIGPGDQLVLVMHK